MYIRPRPRLIPIDGRKTFSDLVSDVSFRDDGIKWGRIEVSWWVRALS